MKELLSFHLSQWNCGHERFECIFEPRYIRASKTLKPQTASISTTSWKPHPKHSKHAENRMDTEKKTSTWYTNRRENIWENLHASSIMLYFGFQLGICRLAFQVRSDFTMHDMKYASTLLTKGSTGNLNCSYCPIFSCTVLTQLCTIVKMILSRNQFQPKKSHPPSQWKQRSACHEKEKLLESLPAPCMQVSGATQRTYTSLLYQKTQGFLILPMEKKTSWCSGASILLGS